MPVGRIASSPFSFSAPCVERPQDDVKPLPSDKQTSRDMDYKMKAIADGNVSAAIRGYKNEVTRASENDDVEPWDVLSTPEWEAYVRSIENDAVYHLAEGIGFDAAA